MSTELPTRTAIFVNALAALDSARTALSDARDWLASDWTPVGSALTPEAAEARRTILTGIGTSKNAIDTMKQDLHRAITSLREA
ncbi:hypothetical protein [Mycobacterium sp. IDR2000157661]|uniref:hypothetical protein n=1 Tax=Mycobacterium sp. IDR2000157661 TaxID=2867005 RepID=UPI001EEC640B|nr:hypothetical protein [Mycobacterium sp. IDR2000157661]ULE31138.1 hypothetical protein K3G64_00160 [Mycobacterium sp. IDR2000157661]